MQVTYLSDGIMKGTIKVTNEGNFVSISKGGNATSAQGQGVITTKDGTEKASLGDSSKPPTGYDGNTTAEDIYQLVSQLGLGQEIYLVGHDVGAQTAYSFATSYILIM